MECGLLLAKEQKLSQIILESDALTAVTSVIAVETSGYLYHVYQGSQFACFVQQKREYNKAAHVLAQYVRQKEESQVWKEVCPSMVIHVIQEDGI